MKVPISKCFGLSVGTNLYAVDEEQITGVAEKLEEAKNSQTPFFTVLGLTSAELSAANQQYDAKEARLREVEDDICSLMNTLSIRRSGSAKMKKLKKLNKEVQEEIKNNQEQKANQNQKREDV
jgi:uncharacterized protein with GYD domain